MADLPNTDSPVVAAIAAALEISKAVPTGVSGTDATREARAFERRLERFVTAYRFIIDKALEAPSPTDSPQDE